MCSVISYISSKLYLSQETLDNYTDNAALDSRNLTLNIILPISYSIVNAWTGISHGISAVGELT